MGKHTGGELKDETQDDYKASGATKGDARFQPLNPCALLQNL